MSTLAYGSFLHNQFISLFKYKALSDFQNTFLPFNELIDYLQILIAVFSGIFLKLSFASSRA